MPRKPLDIRFTDYPYAVEKGLLLLFLLPARTGPGRARQWVKGLVPCRFLGQRPEPPEGFPFYDVSCRLKSSLITLSVSPIRFKIQQYTSFISVKAVSANLLSNGMKLPCVMVFLYWTSLSISSLDMYSPINGWYSEKHFSILSARAPDKCRRVPRM